MDTIKKKKDLVSSYPLLVKEWHREKNGSLKPSDFEADSTTVVWWKCEKGHEWKTNINKRVKGSKCPYCLNRRLLKGYNDLETVKPSLCLEWHPNKNGTLRPQDVLVGSERKVWWKCPKCGGEWEAEIRKRNSGNGCPFCAGKRVLIGFNDLQTLYPSIAKEWHPSRNGALTPQMVTSKSGKKVWWKCPACGYEWETTVESRTLGGKCPKCHNNKKREGKMRKRKPTLVSLFSGCGGLDLGFDQAGFKRIWANDFDKDAQAVFKLNLGDIDGRDIREVDETEIPDCDVIIAGFPCQPFSNAGNRKGVHDSRGMLYQECLRIIESKMPKVILFENVKGLMSTKYVDGRRLVEVIASDLENMDDIGYNVSYEVLNASDYRVPQNRQRLIMIGVRKDLGITFKFPEKQSKEGLTLGNILDIPEDIPNQVDWPLSPQAQSMIEKIPEGGSWKSIDYEDLSPRFQRIRDDMKRYHAPNFYRRFARNEINGTITASAQPENCGIVHPTKNRRYTIREIARIQTFPDDFVFIDDGLKNITAMYKVIGNAVPVKMANAVANAIMEQVFKDK